MNSEMWVLRSRTIGRSSLAASPRARPFVPQWKGRPTVCTRRPPIAWSRHGPYRYWTRKIAGKTASRLLSPEQAERYAPWLENDKRLHALARELEALAIRAAEQAEWWGEK